jgi:chloramphenicol 3-O-phosphotransferase
MTDTLDSAVVVITGIMAAGKSTVAQLLAERLPRSVHVRGDVFRRMMVSGREDPQPRPSSESVAQLRLRYRVSAAVADMYADAGWTAIVQDVILGEHLDDYLAAVRTRPLHLVVLAPDPAAVTTREAQRPKNGYGAWTVADLDHALRHETPHHGLWLDTTQQSPDQTVAAILSHLDAARIDTPPGG